MRRRLQDVFSYRQDCLTAGIKFTHRPKIRFFTPQGRLVAPIHAKLGRADGHGVRLPVQHFTSIATGGGVGVGWECGPKNITNFHFLVKSPPLTDFEIFYGLLYD